MKSITDIGNHTCGHCGDPAKFILDSNEKFCLEHASMRATPEEVARAVLRAVQENQKLGDTK